MELSILTNEEPGKSIRDQLCFHLDGLPENERLQQVLALIDTAAETDERVAEIIREAWDYLKANQLWRCRYSTLEALQEAISYEEVLKSIIEKHDILTARKQGEARGIYENWGKLPHESLPARLCPPRYSERLLRDLNQLSKICALDQAIALLDCEISQRQSILGKGWRRSKEPYVLRRDVFEVLCQLKQLNPQLEENESSEGRQGHQAEGTTPINGADMGDKDNDDEDVELEEISPMEENGEGDIADDGDVNMEGNKAKSLLDSQHIRDPLFHMDVDKSDIQPPSKDTCRPILCRPHLKTQSRVTRSVTRLNRADNTLSGGGDGGQASQDTTLLKAAEGKSKPGYCSCSIGVKELVSSFAVSPEAPQQGAALASLREIAPFESICRNHLRRFAGNALDMVTNITTVALLKRLEWMYCRKRQIRDVRRVRPSWFHGQSGDVWRETPPVFVKAIKGLRDDFNFDAKQVFNRFAGEDSWDRWLLDGTLILPNIFEHLRRVESEIHSEFDMYAFHLGKQPGLPTMGWMRNMYHSGPQQLIYQDPVLWALTTAARPDKYWRLIAYPYNAKNAAAGQKAGFLHLDLDLKRHQSEGLGRNMVQSSVSLTDENDKGCTLVVPGFHKRFQEWVKTKWDLIDSKASRRSTTDMKGLYTAEDRVRFGKPVPAPCPAWGIRLSRSDIIHGSTDEGTQQRQVIFPWFTAINDDHTSMENPDCMNWEELSSCHGDLVGPVKESLGDQPRKGVAGVRFPGAIPVRSAYSLPQALVGLKQWTEPDVIFERNILLGPDDKQAIELAKNIRKQLVDTYKLLYPLIEVREQQAFGDRSFFAENDLVREEDDVGLDEDSE